MKYLNLILLILWVAAVLYTMAAWTMPKYVKVKNRFKGVLTGFLAAVVLSGVLAFTLPPAPPTAASVENYGTPHGEKMIDRENEPVSAVVIGYDYRTNPRLAESKYYLSDRVVVGQVVDVKERGGEVYLMIRAGKKEMIAAELFDPNQALGVVTGGQYVISGLIKKKKGNVIEMSAAYIEP